MIKSEACKPLVNLSKSENVNANIEYLNISYPEGTVLPDSCKYYGASNLVQVNSTNPYLKIENDMMLSKDGKTLYHIYKIPDDGTLIIPDGIETIESNVLPYEINNLKEIVLPQNNINISADFLLFSNDNGVKINIPANARINNSNINYIYWINTNLSVDAKNPVLAEKNGYFYDKKENKVYRW